MPAKEPQRIKSISEFHRVKGLPMPDHPLVSLVNFGDMKTFARRNELYLVSTWFSGTRLAIVCPDSTLPEHMA